MIIDKYAEFLSAQNIPFTLDPPQQKIHTIHLVDADVSVAPSGMVTVRKGSNTSTFPYESVEKLHDMVSSI